MTLGTDRQGRAWWAAEALPLNIVSCVLSQQIHPPPSLGRSSGATGAARDCRVLTDAAYAAATLLMNAKIIASGRQAGRQGETREG